MAGNQRDSTATAERRFGWAAASSSIEGALCDSVIMISRSNRASCTAADSVCRGAPPPSPQPLAPLKLKGEGVEVLAFGPTHLRAVTHMDVDREGIERAIGGFREVFA